jgi:hypothetical protein
VSDDGIHDGFPLLLERGQPVGGDTDTSVRRASALVGSDGRREGEGRRGREGGREGGIRVSTAKLVVVRENTRAQCVRVAWSIRVASMYQGHINAG